MLYVKPFNTEFTNLYTQKNFAPCCTLQYTMFSVSIRRCFSRVVESNSNDFACFYQNIIYGQSEKHYDRMGNSSKFTHDYVVPLNVEGMFVE
ncbi:uncharacterized protein Dyak_GE29094 [Drosophila yakuba]|uniref:Uncharacterized protein n=1 Tax=Drosophila yakuba TaxID=7245 RepID=A0A0R1DKT6_DROYA|nr:uncharacterized protein Dyak_GE29094 [Drosophila yakuba]